MSHKFVRLIRDYPLWDNRKYDIWMVSDDMVFMLNLVKIGHLVQFLKGNIQQKAC